MKYLNDNAFTLYADPQVALVLLKRNLESRKIEIESLKMKSEEFLRQYNEAMHFKHVHEVESELLSDSIRKLNFGENI